MRFFPGAVKVQYELYGFFYLTNLFGEPPVLFKEKINYKLPGCRPDKLHQDQAAGWNA